METNRVHANTLRVPICWSRTIPTSSGGYGELVEILGDPHHPGHGERLEWLGLGHAADFRPASFDPAEVNQALAVFR